MYMKMLITNYTRHNLRVNTEFFYTWCKVNLVRTTVLTCCSMSYQKIICQLQETIHITLSCTVHVHYIKTLYV